MFPGDPRYSLIPATRFFYYNHRWTKYLKNLPRSTQILYPKDIGYILVKMGIGPGTRIIEAGTGSGAFTIALAYHIGVEGQIVSYECRVQMQSNARKNLERFNLLSRVELKLKDISEGFDEQGMDAIFLDIPNPYDYIEQVRKALNLADILGVSYRLPIR